MTDAFLTMATGAATAFVDGDEAGSQDRAVGLELFHAGLELALDQREMFRDVHGFDGIEIGPCISEKYIYLSDKARKKSGAKKNF